MRGVMLLVLRAGARYKCVECGHLCGHVFHLGVDDADSFFVDGVRGCLDGGVMVVYGLKRERRGQFGTGVLKHRRNSRSSPSSSPLSANL